MSRQQPQAQNSVDRQDRRLWSSRERSAVRWQPSPQAKARRLRPPVGPVPTNHRATATGARKSGKRKLFSATEAFHCAIFGRLPSARHLANNSGRPSASPHRSRRQATPEQKRSIRLRRRRAARRAGPWSEHVRSVAIMERLGGENGGPIMENSQFSVPESG